MQGASESNETINESSKRWNKKSNSSRSPSSSSERTTQQRREDALRERGLFPPLQLTTSLRSREPQWDKQTLVEANTGEESSQSLWDDKLSHEDEARPTTQNVLDWLSEMDAHRGYIGDEGCSGAESSDIPADIAASPLLEYQTPNISRHPMHSGEHRNDVESSTLSPTSSPSHSECSSLTCATDSSSVRKKRYTEQLRIDIPSTLILRPVLNITIHSHGTIMMEASHIEDDESRRLTEVAYLA